MGTKTRQILLESEQYFLKAQSLEEQAKSNEQDIVQLRESIEDTKKQIDKWQCQVRFVYFNDLTSSVDSVFTQTKIRMD